MTPALIATTVIDGLEGTLEVWHVLVTVLAPVVIGLITNEDTRRRIRQALPAVAAVGAAAITALAEAGIGVEVVALVPVIWAAIEVSYRAWSGVVSAVTGTDRSVNEVLLPGRSVVR